MSVLTCPKIDCHNHVIDPQRFPYAEDTPYRPAGQEVATAEHLLRVMDTFNVRYALLVGTNSGYGADSRCLLDAIATANGRFKGIAVVENDVSVAELERLKSRGIIGIAFNPTFHGTDYYLGARDLLQKLVELDLLLQLQVEGDQLLPLLPLIEASTVKLLIDHCGRPIAEKGLGQPGFQALLALGRAGRAAVKLSGWYKFSRQPYPHPDAWPFIQALADAFTLDACMWGSDWPFLRAPQRLDYGPLLTLAAMQFPDAADQQKLFWNTPHRWFGFQSELDGG
jgi:predicted TIM-barrel fold metal-dependent hydrolase